MDHGIDHAGQEGYQPDQPYKHTQFMEFPDAFFLFGEQHNRCPDRVAEHEHNGQGACDAVEIEFQSAGDVGHEGGAGGVEDKADPEQQQMPGFQASGEFLAPDPNGIEKQRCVDGDNCES